MKRFLSAIMSIFLLMSITPTAIAHEEKVTIIVELEGEAALARKEAIAMGASIFNQTEQADRITRSLITVQRQARENIQKSVDRNAEIGFTYTNLINGFSITVDKSDIEKIKSLPDVKAVYKSLRYTYEKTFETSVDDAEATSDECCEVMNIPYMHENGYSGQGQAIAVIDSELDVNHEFFSTPIENPKYSKSDIAALIKNESLNVNISANRVYKSEKIPFAYNYSMKNSDVYSRSGIHGTHVTGIAAGKNGTLENGSRFSGVAPETQIIFMGVLEDGRILSDDAVLAAADDASKMDIAAINMSFSSAYVYSYPLYEKIINTASEAGILISAGAGNEGRGGRLSLKPENIDYSSSGIPCGISSAASVASANSKTLKMSSFSSWGTNASLELKPEITAPGQSIYSSYPDDGYIALSGTSMAAPHMTGSAALMRQYIDKNYPNVANKASFMENLMMSGANILYIDKENKIPYSPRNQGAGMIDLKAAVATPVILKGESGKSKISLKDKIGSSFNIEFIAENIADSEVTYDTIELSVITDDYEEALISGSKPLKFTATLPERVTVPANDSVNVSFNVDLNEEELAENSEIFTNGFFVEGYVMLSDSAKTIPQINIPYMGFYGDWTKASVFDKPYYEQDSRFGQTRLKSGQGSCKTKISQAGFEYCTCVCLGMNIIAYKDKTHTYDASVYEGESYAGYSSNGDGEYDYLCIEVYPERTIADAVIRIKNSGGATVFEEDVGYIEKYSFNHFDIDEKFPDDDYVVVVEGRLPYEGSESESVEMRFYIDTEAPVITSYSERKGSGKRYVNISASDNRYIMGFRASGKSENGEEVCVDIPSIPAKDANAEIDVSDITPDTLEVAAVDYALNFTKYAENDFDAKISGTPIFGRDSTVMMFEIANNTDSAVSAEIIAAAYDKTGTFKCFSIKNKEQVKTGLQEKSFVFNKALNDSDIVKLMLWDGIEAMRPIYKNWIFNINK